MPYAVVVYDVADDRRRAALSALLCELGPRVQLSVFEVELPSPRDRTELCRHVMGIIDQDEDQVRIYDLYSFAAKRTILGNRILEERQPFYVV